ncbi:MAG: REP element-mobilizing transposase RayT [Phycisphaerales bacterium]|jgi:REP element-mobilizing transposase RayT
MPCLAYFLTWTTYGTWLHGDQRGSVVDQNNSSFKIVEHTPRHQRTATRLEEPAFLLDSSSRALVEDTIHRVAQHRNWTIHALNARSNHVHVVVSSSTHRPEIVAGQFKSWATRDLHDAGAIDNRKRIWTAKASTRWLNDEKSLHAAIDYVKNHQ